MSNEPGTMKGIETPDDDSKVAENTEGTEWDLREMSAAYLGGTEYRILSTRNGSVNHYQIDIAEGSCECESQEYNLRQNEACPHLAKAILVHAARDTSEITEQNMHVLTDRAQNLIHDLRDATDWASTLIESEARSASGDAAQNGAPDTSEPASTSNTSAADAAERLQDAFDSVVDGMAVEHSGGVVWVNKTPDAPDTLPGPGNVEVFEAFLQNPDHTIYVHDDHELAGDKPGKYFGNAIEPSDVDEYISEVLE